MTDKEIEVVRAVIQKVENDLEDTGNVICHNCQTYREFVIWLQGFMDGMEDIQKLRQL